MSEEQIGAKLLAFGIFGLGSYNSVNQTYMHIST